MATRARPSVAVVEDDEPVRRALVRVLAAAGFRVASYASAEDYLAAANMSAQCVLVDINLREMSGLDLCERLRRGTTPTSVVLLTADHDLARSQRVRRRGAVCLTKPVDELALVTAITRALKGDEGSRL
jgi:FixJ family two-component response regulator